MVATAMKHHHGRQHAAQVEVEVAAKKQSTRGGSDGNDDSSCGGIVATLPCMIIMAAQSGSHLS